jgi:hypothetical protein
MQLRILMPHQPIPIEGLTNLEHGAYIYVSEIADFVYCERSWWLEKNNYFGLLKRGRSHGCTCHACCGKPMP